MVKVQSSSCDKCQEKAGWVKRSCLETVYESLTQALITPFSGNIFIELNWRFLVTKAFLDTVQYRLATLHLITNIHIFLSTNGIIML